MDDELFKQLEESVKNGTATEEQTRTYNNELKIRGEAANKQTTTATVTKNDPTTTSRETNETTTRTGTQTTDTTTDYGKTTDVTKAGGKSFVGMRLNEDGSINKEDYDAYNKERKEAIEAPYRHFKDIVGPSEAKLRSERARQAIEDQRLAKAAEYTNIGRLVSKMIAAGTGGNVTADMDDTTAKEAWKRSREMRLLNDAEEQERAFKQWQRDKDMMEAVQKDRKDTDKALAWQQYWTGTKTSGQDKKSAVKTDDITTKRDGGSTSTRTGGDRTNVRVVAPNGTVLPAVPWATDGTTTTNPYGRPPYLQ